MDNLRREDYIEQRRDYAPPAPAPTPPADYGYAATPDAYSYNVHQRTVDAYGNAVERDEAVVEDPYLARTDTLNRVSQIAYFLFGVLEVAILIRFALYLLGANLSEGFGAFMRGVSAPFVAPFVTVLPSYNLNAAGTSILELGDLLAVAIYALLAYGLVKLLWLIAAPTRSGRSVSSSVRRRTSI